jgi:hypothetical protein
MSDFLELFRMEISAGRQLARPVELMRLRHRRKMIRLRKRFWALRLAWRRRSSRIQNR